MDVECKDKFKLCFFPGSSLHVYVVFVALPSIRAQPATGRWEFPPANWWQWSIRQHTHEAPDCAKPRRPPTKQLEKDLFMIGSCIIFSCTHLIKHIAWWPHWSYFICQTNMECVLHFVLSIYFFHKEFKAFKWNMSSHALDPKDISFHSEITLILSMFPPHSRHWACSGAGPPKVHKGLHEKLHPLVWQGLPWHLTRFVLLIMFLALPNTPILHMKQSCVLSLLTLFDKKWDNSHISLLNTNHPRCASQSTLCERGKGACSHGLFWECREQFPAVLFSLFV